eukprot:CAMPEP_0173274200 /NCGR_PEP_ID=MMETSP1143-20121109/2317_1 /TAXON_ID=483371 /ORGANISM="non described non described, Strain CCMP2298" /LENGTH=166 /DNA_ID=CAMNT_0014211003 /DNA_START=166 /DNA_END=662 /DNA_ORIENTATION=+
MPTRDKIGTLRSRVMWGSRSTTGGLRPQSTPSMGRPASSPAIMRMAAGGRLSENRYSGAICPLKLAPNENDASGQGVEEGAGKRTFSSYTNVSSMWMESSSEENRDRRGFAWRMVMWYQTPLCRGTSANRLTSSPPERAMPTARQRSSMKRSKPLCADLQVNTCCT